MPIAATRQYTYRRRVLAYGAVVESARRPERQAEDGASAAPLEDRCHFAGPGGEKETFWSTQVLVLMTDRRNNLGRATIVAQCGATKAVRI
jgi:hypothetical protein